MFASYPKYSQMLSQTEANYKTAQAYYAQKETAFRQALAKNSGDIYGEYINSLINELLLLNVRGVSIVIL